MSVTRLSSPVAVQFFEKLKWLDLFSRGFCGVISLLKGIRQKRDAADGEQGGTDSIVIESSGQKKIKIGLPGAADHSAGFPVDESVAQDKFTSWQCQVLDVALRERPKPTDLTSAGPEIPTSPASV